MNIPMFSADRAVDGDTDPYRGTEGTTRHNGVVPAYLVQVGTTIWQCNSQRCLPIASAPGGISGYTYL